MMKKMTSYAEIPQVNGVAFTDPAYDESVWCQYRTKLNSPESGWVMKLDTTRDEDDYILFALSLGRRTVMSGLSFNERPDGSAGISHYDHHVLDEKKVGIDTAQVFVGSLDTFEQFGEEGSIYTASDGLFGDLYVATCKGEKDPSGFLLVGAIDGSITDEESLFRTVVASFEAKEISQKRFENLTNDDDLDLRKQFAKEIRQANAFERHDEKKPTKGKSKDSDKRPER